MAPITIVSLECKLLLIFFALDYHWAARKDCAIRIGKIATHPWAVSTESSTQISGG